jgi:hypothetical protein
MQYLQNEKERERVTFFQAMRADIFINISYKGEKFFDFWFFCRIHQSATFHNITIFKAFFIYTSLSCFTEIVTF